MYEDEFELTFDTPEEEPVYEPEKASAAPAPVPETTPAEIVPDEPTGFWNPAEQLRQNRQSRPRFRNRNRQKSRSPRARRCPQTGARC